MLPETRNVSDVVRRFTEMIRREESTCEQMQQRVNLPGQSWDKPGPCGVLAMRALVLSDRWPAAWQPYAVTHRKEVRATA